MAQKHTPDEEDEDESREQFLQVSDALRIIPIPNKVLLREQAKDYRIKEIKTLLDVDSDEGRNVRKKFEEMEGLVYKVEQDDEHDQRG